MVDDPVTFACGLKLSGTASRTERGDARSVPVEFLLPGKQHEPRDRPQEMKDVLHATVVGGGRLLREQANARFP